jgi:hypothetical protein
VDQITGVTLIQPLPLYPRLFPVYASDMEGYMTVQQRLKASKIKMQEWTERTPREPEGFQSERRLVCVPIGDLGLAQDLIKIARLTPVPDVHKERRVA